MQQVKPRSQAERTDATRNALITAARHLFITKGFAATGTPEIVAAAGVTRGALYHHFSDKTDLFDAVIRAEAQAVSDAIRGTDLAGVEPVQALVAGGKVFLAAMAAPGRVRLMLVDAPSVLGPQRLSDIDGATGGATLEEGLAALLPPDAPVRATAALLSAAFDRAALAIDGGGDTAEWQQALALIICGLAKGDAV